MSWKLSLSSRRDMSRVKLITTCLCLSLPTSNAAVHFISHVFAVDPSHLTASSSASVKVHNTSLPSISVLSLLDLVVCMRYEVGFISLYRIYSMSECILTFWVSLSHTMLQKLQPLATWPTNGGSYSFWLPGKGRIDYWGRGPCPNGHK